MGKPLIASCTLAELFEQNITVHDGDNGLKIKPKLKIPLYQRAYVWREKELTQLLTDFKSYNFTDSENEKKPQYYLGSIIAHIKEKNNEKHIYIIDGQQRITTMAIIAIIQGEECLDLYEKYPNLALEYHSPESQTNIRKNYHWLTNNKIYDIDDIDFNQINITLTLTDSEDMAYNFFETLNTGGVRLGGADIIKAHHLRAIQQQSQDGNATNQAAKKWESMAHVADSNRKEALIPCLLRGRYWNTIDFKEFLHTDTKALRNAIVQELAINCDKNNENIGFGRYRVKYDGLSRSEDKLSVAYDLRQPLNEGQNTVDYLYYFDDLYTKYFPKTESQEDNRLAGYYEFYRELSTKDDIGYMLKCFQTALLIYIAQFGDCYLEIVAKKLSRVIFSLRLSQSRVVAKSIPKLLRENTPIFDWITNSYTPAQLCSRLDAFQLKPMAEPNNKARKFLGCNDSDDFVAKCTGYDDEIKSLTVGGTNDPS